jgi:hypothetical protein
MPALLLNAAATLFMTGLIWFVQVVHYPLFALVQGPAAPAYAARHQALTTLVVGPVMLAELAGAIWLAVLPPPGVPAWIPRLALLLLATIWVSTALWQVPLHQKLLAGHEAATIGSLVSGNWLRTVLWTVRGGAALWMIKLAFDATRSAT